MLYSKEPVIVIGSIMTIFLSLICFIVWQTGRVNKVILQEVYGIEMTTWQASWVSITLNGETE